MVLTVLFKKLRKNYKLMRKGGKYFEKYFQINEKNRGIIEKRYISYIRYRFQAVSI
jgi:hypothetical protein